MCCILFSFSFASGLDFALGAAAADADAADGTGVSGVCGAGFGLLRDLDFAADAAADDAAAGGAAAGGPGLAFLLLDLVGFELSFGVLGAASIFGVCPPFGTNAGLLLIASALLSFC